ncbi:hypothetical protein [Spirosoma luteum]|uniref:hypothetical protein n=1 Tax=Spirosoma luteum TaxID=431553 RepID=UPI00037CDC1B|nr:hypothetical protein [Spirosoma luteum]
MAVELLAGIIILLICFVGATGATSGVVGVMDGLALLLIGLLLVNALPFFTLLHHFFYV